MSTYGTSFGETEALLAAQSGDAAELARLIADMLPGERRRLSDAAQLLSNVLWDAEGRPDGWGWERRDEDRRFRREVVASEGVAR